MASGKFHFSISLLAGLIYQRYTNDNIVYILTGFAIGGLLPDIDNISTISELVPVLRKPWQVIHKSTNAMYKHCRRHKWKVATKALKSINDLFDHRGLSHSVFIPLLFYIFTYNNANYTLQYGIIIGMLSHIVTDMLFGGCKLLAPFYNSRVHIMNIKSCGAVENVLNSIMWIVIVWICIPLEYRNESIKFAMSVLEMLKEG